MKLSAKIETVQASYKSMADAVMQMKKALDMNDSEAFNKAALELKVLINRQIPGVPDEIRTPKDTTESYQTKPSS